MTDLSILFAPFVFAAWMIGVGSDAPNILIEQVTVPKQAEERGFGPKLVGERLSKRITEVALEARTSRLRQTAEVGNGDDIASALTQEFDVDGQVVLAHRLLGMIDHRFRVHMTDNEKGYLMQVLDYRPDGSSTLLLIDPSAEIDTIIDKAAFRLVKHIEPYIAANVVYQRERAVGPTRSTREQTMRALGHCFAICNEADQRWLWLLYGAILSDDGNHPEAINAYNRALSLDPYFLPAIVNIGGTLLQQSDLDGAEDRLTVAMEMATSWGARAADYDPVAEIAEIHYHLGKLASRRNQPAETISSFEKSIAIGLFDPVAVRTDLAKVLIEQDRVREALTLYREAIRILPERGDLQVRFFELLREYDWPDLDLAGTASAK